MIQHVVRRIGGVTENLQSIAALYPGVSWEDIADSTFGGHSVSAIYDWLQANGGIPGGAYGGHDSGTHWIFAPGMVVNVPSPGPSQSPPVGAPNERPGGGAVDVGDPDPQYQGAAVGGGGGLMTWLLVGVAVYMLFGDKKKKRKTSKRRKTTRRRTKRRRRR